MKTDYRALELKLRRIVERRLNGGFMVAPGITVPGASPLPTQSQCCLLGAVGIEAGADPRGDAWQAKGLASAYLRIGIDDQIYLEAGFEQWEMGSGNRRLYNIGARIRAIYVDDNGVVE